MEPDIQQIKDKLKLVYKVLNEIYLQGETDREDAYEARKIVQDILNDR